ncbi:valine--tRNA ligase [Candidatus Kaiserbacteria bacterium RIFCSPLOWO2_01_FULL_55_19]|uniref:Valine--tRNA ligase n=1 Tax=Candidatus Kaiserbacteria bacterium RIFCSPLOWO2_01_FULL_55_19 TaxID=1798516 RepID=A0A1F6ES32_9BACT|nr:MAG: valine--tRNA ligase [Candidatus Kaiserbacteria bacterium RIFCSPLOWO2_01_FULL_55_19]
MPEKFMKPYDPAATESRIYAAWEESGLFNPDECVKQGITPPDAPSYSIVLPPPNVTGRLHMGHALMLAVEDIFIRYKRMQGFRTLWVPGTDHAAIATQSVVEKQIKKDENKNRHDLGREELLKRIGTFAAESHDMIVSQLKTMGASLDWSREAFTLDETRTHAVRKIFKDMYDAGLIYRGHRIVNWDPKGQTTISDDEIVYQEEKTTFYYLKYGPFTIGTARPETKFGDKYVVMHPADARYEEWKDGQKIELEWINGPIEATIVKDESIDMEFGTGVMTITPWHSMVDFDVAERHGLDKEQIIDERGKLLSIAGEFAGMKITEARARIIEKLRKKGLLVSEESYTHNIATAERTSGIIEPQIKLQWFVEVNKKISGRNKTLKELMLEPVRSRAIKIVPEHFEKTYFHWIENLRDWCISRQIWYGHRIPVWYRGEEISVGIEPKEAGWTQDEDTLDTWFSSGLWTFSTLGWPEQTDDLKRYHPTDLLETGYDILFFWIARMILMTEFALNTIPFKTVYLHGLVRDAQGRKMSKSLGNNLDPLDIAAKFGADAARMALVVGNTPGTDMRMSEDKIKGYKHFANKLWNIARFVLTNASEEKNGSKTWPSGPERDHFSPREHELLTELDTLAKEMTDDIENHRVYLAAEKIYHYVWHTLADKIIEESKPLLAGTDSVKKESRQTLLLRLLDQSLRLLHPFMPFVTEEIWQSMPTKDAPFLMVARWPKPAKGLLQ